MAARVVRRAAIAGVIGVAGVAGWLAHLALPWWFGDADWYASALPALRGSAPLYAPRVLLPHLSGRPVDFNLPPADALLAPLAALGRGPWGFLMLACLIMGLALVWPQLRAPWDIVLGLVLVTSIPVLSAVIWANVNSLVVLLIAIAIRWRRQAGWAIGVATAIKVAPVFLFAWLIGRRDWRGVAIGVATAAGLTVFAALLTDPMAIVQFVIVQLNEIPNPNPFDISLAAVGLPAIAGFLAALCLGAVAAWRGSLLLATLAAVVAVPVIHAHYLVWILLPLLATRQPVLEFAPRAIRGGLARLPMGSASS